MYWPEWTNGIEYAVAIVPHGIYSQQLSCPGFLSCIPSQNRYRYGNLGTEVDRKKYKENKEYKNIVGELKDRIKTLGQTDREKETKIKDLERDVERLKTENRDLKQKCTQMEYRSMEITRKMSELTDSRGNFENVNDEFANSNLARKFESLYANKWVFLARWLAKALPSIHEVERISLLTSIMKRGYEECTAAADDQICTMFRVEKWEDIPSTEDLSELLTMRRRYGVRDSARNQIKQEVSKQLLDTEDMRALCSGENGPSTEVRLQEFLNEYLDLCWLLSVANPPVILKFDVVGKPYTECRDHFTTYSTKKPVEDMSKDGGTVYAVVWPCAKLQDNSAIYMKGDVVLVKKGKQEIN